MSCVFSQLGSVCREQFPYWGPRDTSQLLGGFTCLPDLEIESSVRQNMLCICLYILIVPLKRLWIFTHILYIHKKEIRDAMTMFFLHIHFLYFEKKERTHKKYICTYIHPSSAPRNDSSPRIPFCVFLNHRTSKTTKQNLDKRQEKGELQKSLKIKGTRSHPSTPPSPNGVTQTPYPTHPPT